MDWDHAIRRNSEVLAGIVADLFAMLGLIALTDTVSRLPWPTYRAVLRGFSAPPRVPCGGSLWLRRGVLWLRLQRHVPSGQEASRRNASTRALFPSSSSTRARSGGESGYSLSCGRA